ncbi:MAG: hypothetical protein ABI321_15275 [Polyangia bacterium]
MRAIALLLVVSCGACGSSHAGGGGTIEITASGEALALAGYPFPPQASGDAAFVDGWEVSFQRFITVFDKVTIAENPDTNPGDQAQTGKVVAELDGPWAVDLSRGGPIEGKGGADEEALAVGTIDSKSDGSSFDPSVRYAFSYASVAATAGAKLLNFVADDADYAEMVSRGWNVLYVGTATFKGKSCTSTDSSYDFSKLPSPVTFRLGFATPASYLNCQNPDNDPAKALGAEEHQRGIHVTNNAQTIAQVTFHSDHPFWESIVHDSPAHFDQLAALAKQQTDGTWLVTLDDTTAADYTAFTDQSGKPLPWHACQDGYVAPNSSPQMGFDSRTLGYNPSGDPSSYLRGYGDFMVYDQSTQGHLDSDGLCYVQRHYASPL